MSGKPSEAIAAYRESIRLRPGFAEAINDLAWLLATHPDDKIRNVDQAIELATQACEVSGYRQPVPLTTLAAAYAEAGRFEEATRTAERALALAKAANHAEYTRQAETVLACVKNHRPYRISGATN